MKAWKSKKEQTIASERYCPVLSTEYQDLFQTLTKRLRDTLPMNRAKIIGNELNRISEIAEETDLECKKYMAALSVLVDLSLQGWIFDFQDDQLTLKMENDTILSNKWGAVQIPGGYAVIVPAPASDSSRGGSHTGFAFFSII